MAERKTVLGPDLKPRTVIQNQDEFIRLLTDEPDDADEVDVHELCVVAPLHLAWEELPSFEGRTVAITRCIFLKECSFVGSAGSAQGNAITFQDCRFGLTLSIRGEFCYLRLKEILAENLEISLPNRTDSIHIEESRFGNVDIKALVGHGLTLDFAANNCALHFDPRTECPEHINLQVSHGIGTDSIGWFHYLRGLYPTTPVDFLPGPAELA